MAGASKRVPERRSISVEVSYHACPCDVLCTYYVVRTSYKYSIIVSNDADVSNIPAAPSPWPALLLRRS